MRIPQLPAWILVAALVASLASPTLAQTPPADAVPDGDGVPFVDTVDIQVVNVEIYVTDKDDQPVTGLGVEDFEIYEDGRRQEVTNFYAVEARRPAIAPNRIEPLDEGAPPPPLWTPPSEAEQRLHLIVYFDNLFLRPANRNKVIDQVERFLHTRVEREDQVMLVTYDRGIHVRQAFTNDLDVLVEQLGKIEKLSSFAVQKETDRREVLERVETAQDGFSAESHVDFYAKNLHFDVRQSIGALEEIVGSLAGLPGRKALLYVSDGLPMTPGEDLFHLLELRFQGAGGPLQAQRYRVRRDFRDLIARANANRVTFYTLEAAGLRSHQSLSAEYGHIDSQDLIEIDAIRDATREEPLMYMAEETGGLAAFNTNNLLGALDEMARDFGTYYSLGYRPVHFDAGRYHEIEIKIAGRKGLKVRHRKGYRDKTPDVRLNEGTMATLLYGVGDNRLDIELRFGQPTAAEKGEVLLPLEVRIPIGKLALLPQGGLHTGRLVVSTAVIDPSGRLSDPVRRNVPLQIPDADIEAARGQFFVYEAQLRIRRGGHRVAVVVLDELSGETASVARAVEIGG